MSRMGERHSELSESLLELLRQSREITRGDHSLVISWDSPVARDDSYRSMCELVGRDPYPTESRPCEHEWRAAESGYVRTWSIDRHDDGTLTAHYSGASDFSDDGDGDVYLECRTCLTREAIPAGTVMDWQ
jgi:hypothetical protein